MTPGRAVPSSYPVLGATNSTELRISISVNAQMLLCSPASRLPCGDAVEMWLYLLEAAVLPHPNCRSESWATEVSALQHHIPASITSPPRTHKKTTVHLMLLCGARNSSRVITPIQMSALQQIYQDPLTFAYKWPCLLRSFHHVCIAALRLFLCKIIPEDFCLLSLLHADSVA